MAQVLSIKSQTDGCLLVGGLEALRVGPAFEETPNLPAPACVGQKGAQLARVVGNGRDRGQDGQCAVARREVVGVVCCWLPC